MLFLIIVRQNQKVRLVDFLTRARVTEATGFYIPWSRHYYNWSTRSIIRVIRSYILNLILSQTTKGRKAILQVMLDLTTLEKVGNFPHLNNLVRVYNHKKGLHIVVMYLVIGNWRFPWSFRIDRGKGTASPAQLAQKLLSNLPSNFTRARVTEATGFYIPWSRHFSLF